MRTMFKAGIRTGAAAVLSTVLLASCATAPVGTGRSAMVEGDLNALAEDYVRLILEIGEREEGYVDAYYGPPEWAAAAEANPRSVDQLTQAAATLTRDLEAVNASGADPALIQRRKYLLAHVSAAALRLRMIAGDEPAFADEAFGLFGIRPEIRPLESYQPVLAEMDALLPGEGSLAERAAAFRARYVIPPERVEAVMQAAIAECKRRTEAHIGLPAGESFDLGFVTDKPWSGYNYYLGNSKSRIEINVELPIGIDRAVDLGCHEGYPGHHVYNALLERTFVTERGWMEMSVYPLFSPMSFVAEGSANYGIDLAFPPAELDRFETEVLYPLAGLDPAGRDDYARFIALSRRLASAEYAIADAYLAGRIDRATAERQLRETMLMAPERAEQRVDFIDTYRSYVINYGLGRDTVQAWVERQGPDHWETTERLLGSQILPVDLLD
ncbi:hypothetical protein [Brevundimonas sp.]|uniref:hypothetical protein n=1 Tax=Brevundimonas sp. TaxID=1871086 RepID=UPI0035B41472